MRSRRASNGGARPLNCGVRRQAMHPNAIGFVSVSMPMWFVYAIGVALALYFFRQKRLQSVIVLASCLLALSLSFANLYRLHWAFSAIDAGADPMSTGIASGMVNFFISIGNATCILAIVVAAFTVRSRDD